MFPWRSEYSKTGLTQDALYLIRPDTYVALPQSDRGTADLLQRYFTKRGIRIGSRGGTHKRCMIWRCAVPGPGVVNGATLCRWVGQAWVTQPTEAARTRSAIATLLHCLPKFQIDDVDDPDRRQTSVLRGSQTTGRLVGPNAASAPRDGPGGQPVQAVDFPNSALPSMAEPTPAAGPGTPFMPAAERSTANWRRSSPPTSSAIRG